MVTVSMTRYTLESDPLEVIADARWQAHSQRRGFLRRGHFVSKDRGNESSATGTRLES